jgi:threonine-phosphate decarboxylase
LIATERQYLMERLAAIPGLTVYPSVTNFLLLKITRPGWDAPRLQQGLIRHGMLIRDCRSFPGLGGGFMRIAVRGRKDNTRLLSALQQTFES